MLTIPIDWLCTLFTLVQTVLIAIGVATLPRKGRRYRPDTLFGLRAPIRAFIGSGPDAEEFEHPQFGPFAKANTEKEYSVEYLNTL